MTKEQAVEKVLGIARAEIGYREKNSASGLDDQTANAGGGNYTKYARDLDRIPGFYNGAKNGYAWCDVFYDWLLYKAFGTILAKRLLCQPDDSAGAGCLYSALYFRQAGQFHTKDPQPGDQIFFTYTVGEVSHTGIVESVSKTTVTTIEGNTSDSVARRSYSINSGTIYGYGRPDWSILKTEEEPAPTTEETPSTNYTIELPTLAYGDESEFVKSLQILLIAHGHYCGGRIVDRKEIPDGEFGPSTENAVRLFQLAHGLTKTGKADKETMYYLLVGRGE